MENKSRYDLAVSLLVFNESTRLFPSENQSAPSIIAKPEETEEMNHVETCKWKIIEKNNKNEIERFQKWKYFFSAHF